MDERTQGKKEGKFFFFHFSSIHSSSWIQLALARSGNNKRARPKVVTTT